MYIVNVHTTYNMYVEWRYIGLNIYTNMIGPLFCMLKPKLSCKLIE